MEYYLEVLSQIDSTCSDFKKKFVNELKIDRLGFPSELRGYFINSPAYQYYLRPLKGVIQIIDAFEIPHLDANTEYLQRIISNLENYVIIERKHGFEKEVNSLIDFFKKEVMQIIKDRLSVLKPEENKRLDEAIHCFLQNCYYSSIVMFVSAIESRLFLLMSSAYPDNKKKLETMPFGALIKEYMENKQKYKNIVPRRHETLLNHCNNMRILSAHPKSETMDKSVTKSILHMSFQFLLDKKSSI
jgi:hypothetical protein